MGLFWDLIQQSQISTQQGKTDSVEARVLNLETELRRTQETLHSLIQLMEKHYGQDLDRDGNGMKLTRIVIDPAAEFVARSVE